MPDVTTQLRLAEAYLDGGAPLEAVAVLEPVADELAGSAAGQALLGRAYYRSAQLGRAQRALEQALRLDPVDSWAHFLLGRTLERAGRPADALTHLRLAAAMSPRPEYVEQRDAVARRLAG